MLPGAFRQDSAGLSSAQTPALHPNKHLVSQNRARLTHLLLLLLPSCRSHCFLPHCLQVARETLGPDYCACTCESWAWGRVYLFYLRAVPSCCSLTSKQETAFLD